ncbi:MAG TPA: glycosyltransferase family 1 protein [Solirubrobacteraceae bacterium]
MHVALNLVFLVPGETGGMETYARELIPRLAAIDGVRLTALVNREAADEDFGCDRLVVPVRARNRIDWVRGEQQHVWRMADRAGADVLHSLGSTAPLLGGARRVTTIHDLNYKLVPETHFGLRGLGMRALVPAAARRSHRIIVDAASTKRDLVEHLGTVGDKIDVVPLAAGPPQVAPVPEEALRAGLRLGTRPVVLSASAKRPHKNIAGLLEALARIPIDRRPVLVVPGYPTPYEAELRAMAAGLGVRDDVVFPEWLEAADLEGLYALAACVVVPSLYEGFGLPVLEAMVRGVPVACSDRSSLPEVAGDAALLFDPEDVVAIASAIERLVGDRELADRLARAGRERAASFSWDRTATQTVESYRRAL